ncbi:structural maintenance of chromosomes protein 5 isoform X1 [Diorhabda sublineata]|uniref:structural maintenance of chromosomes protein 5 isoform X1 n=2 Tax=Diorhabda sublineata TaxID=1163346 RepID=UPI0024E093AF|nr:structural maintenance of chromosomes protein 5 isoform X1 [Diorhabda sublineata]
MYQPGSIRKIEVRNFVTYSHVELYPGPKLNMIIGPNGTGKSTMVAAIILGLGGNPKVVGRGHKISEYVKHNCEVAVINISLQDNEDNKFIKVTREFDIRDRSTWKINGKTVKLDVVLQCIKEFNVQVNNLCQFLPQDRVQDFAKMNKCELLRETQLALCRFDLIEKQDILIKSRDRHKQLQESIDNNQKKLQDCQDLNSRLEGRVESFNKKKKYTEEIEHIERKIAWTMYEGSRNRLTEIKKDKKQAQEIYDKYKNDMQPVEKEMSDKKKMITEVQQNNNKIAQAIKNSELFINANLEKIESVNESIKTLNDDMERKLAEIEQWDEEIQTAVNKLEDMKTLQKETCAKSSESEKTKQILTNEMTKLSKFQQTYQDKKDELLQNKQESILRIRALENESKQLENIKQNRLQYLERLNPDAYQAVNWLRNNKHLFQGEIFEPIMLELNVIDNRHAKYLENVIPLRDRIAFTCTHKDDMNLLIKSLREGKQLSVNVVHSCNKENNSFEPTIAIECLRKYGFYTYMNSLFTAPEPIMNYLCKTYHLHNIPLGDKTTDKYYEDLPGEIKQFFSEKYRYIVSVSKYSGQKSIRQNEVSSDGSFSLTMDIVKMDQLRGQIEQIKRSLTNFDSEIRVHDVQFEKLNEKLNEIRSKLKEIQQQKQNAQTITTRVETLQRKLKEMQQLKKSPDEVRIESQRKGEKYLKSIPGIYSAMQKEVVKLLELEKKNALNIRKIGEIRKRLAYLENEINDKKQQCRESEENLNRIKEVYNDVMEEAKALLVKAKGLSNGLTPADDGFDEFRSKYESLTSEIDALNVQKEQLQSRIACLNVADDGEMREYEDRLKQIDEFSENLQKLNADMNKITTKMGKWEVEWLSPLKQLLSEINLKFATAFERMGCAGEVGICTGENDKDFSQYGISIKVTYRNGEPLQELNSNIQSGGERAVATAAYMLALQELTPVPFRCVDEINQGMDANNERRIFELVVDSTCNEASSQYFLITPKLISHLRYAPNMVIHIVHNGPFVAPDKKWGFSKLCNPQKIHIA